MLGVIDRPALPDGPALVVGLARSGVAAALVLRARGVAVAGCDSGPVAEESRERLEAAGVPVHERSDGLEALERAGAEGRGAAGDVGGSPWLVKSPGVPQSAPVVAAARAAGLAVLG